MQWWLIDFSEIGTAAATEHTRLVPRIDSRSIALGMGGIGLKSIQIAAVLIALAYPPNLLSMLTFWLLESRESN